MQATKGVKLKGLKKVAKGTLPPPPEIIKQDITIAVPSAPTMFGSKKTQAQQQPQVAKIVPRKLNAPKPEPAVEPLKPFLQEPQPQPTKPVEEKKPKKKIVINDEELDEETMGAIADLLENEENEENDSENNSSSIESANLSSSNESSVADVPPELISLQAAVDNEEETDNYTLEESQVYIPQISRSFSKFITTTFADFALPPRPAKLNFEACSTLEMRIYEYQKFIREYMRQASPYRGILVYHGLGSGKTCTSIATAEALYGTANKKIIVMTPISLQENFLNEITVCGFQHFRLQNHWVPFNVQELTTKLFAMEVVGIPESHIKTVLKSRNLDDRVIWMPDFTKPSNYDSLKPEQQTAIRLQITAIIRNRITFIGYTGITHDELKRIACDEPTFFDDAVIIVDEVHNLTRLMRGKLDKYLKNVRGEGAQAAAPAPGKKPKKIPFSYEPFTTETWKPKLCGSSQKYSRAFLIYRLLAQAKNSKIVALSGTPIVNFPEEIGILANILHGYFHAVNDSITSVENADIKKLERILKMHPRVQFYSVEKKEGYSTVFFTKCEDGYEKNFKGDELVGLVHKGDEVVQNTIQEIYEDIVKKAAADKIRFKAKPIYSAIPLFPELGEDFTGYFVDTSTMHIKDKLLFQKRISGLISYYKGAKEELMPKVVKDEIVECPMSLHSLKTYAEARKKEREEKKKSKSGGAWDELQELAKESESASYRFRSRAACNFVFPKGIPRPFPSNKKEFKSAAKVEDVVLGDTEADAVEDDLASQGVAEAIGALEPDEEDEDDAVAELGEVMPSAAAAENMRIPYADRIRIALDALRSVAKRRFSIDPGIPEEEQLANYSQKFVEIIKRIEASPGSSLIYSQFRTLEGIGIFGLVLDFNNYVQLKLVGPDTDLRFSPETEESIRTNPKQPRYIIYSGEESKTVRQTLINIFNTKMSSLPPKIAAVLDESGLLDPATRKGNYKGEICKVFMITGAGAEGLSLRNIRTVHIMEPYWNSVRTDQVKGRAVRICSHSDLHYDEDPAKNERTVEIYTYLSTISEKLKSARQIDQTLITEDNSITTDQHIYKISKEKEQISQDFTNAMKASAIDCTLNRSENERIACFSWDGPAENFLYDPRISEDKKKTDKDLQFVQPTMTAMASAAPPPPAEYPIIKFKGVQYFVVDEGGEKILYLDTDEALTKKMGKLITTPEGKRKIEFF